MRDQILLDALQEIKSQCNGDGEGFAYHVQLIEEIATKALTDWTSAPKEKYSKDEVLAAFKKVFDFDEAFTDNELGYIKTVMDTYAAQFQSSAPESGQNENMTWVKEKIERMITMYDKGGLAQLKKVIELINMSPSSPPESGGEEKEVIEKLSAIKYEHLVDIYKQNKYVPSVQSSDVKEEGKDEPIRLKHLSMNFDAWHTINNLTKHSGSVVADSLFQDEETIFSDFLHTQQTMVMISKKQAADLSLYLLRNGIKITFLDGYKSEVHIQKMSPPLYNKFYAKENGLKGE